MSVKFKKGDKVVVVRGGWAYISGEIVTITGYYISSTKNVCYWTKELPHSPLLELDCRKLTKLEKELK